MVFLEFLVEFNFLSFLIRLNEMRRISFSQRSDLTINNSSELVSERL